MQKVHHICGARCARYAVKSNILLILATILSVAAFSQKKDSTNRKNSLIGYPAVFYLPETRWGIGAGASYNFYINKQDSVSPPSQIQLGIGYTQNNQKLIYLPYDLYWKERKHSLSGEIGYYDYSYYFYGVGPGNESGKRELYDVRFPRFRINYLRKIRDRFFIFQLPIKSQ